MKRDFAPGNNQVRLKGYPRADQSSHRHQNLSRRPYDDKVGDVRVRRYYSVPVKSYCCLKVLRLSFSVSVYSSRTRTCFLDERGLTFVR